VDAPHDHRVLLSLLHQFTLVVLAHVKRVLPVDLDCRLQIVLGVPNLAFDVEAVHAVHLGRHHVRGGGRYGNRREEPNKSGNM